MSNTNNTQPAASIAFTHTRDGVEIEFADGRHTITPDIVGLLGGLEEVEKIATALGATTWAKFIEGINVLRRSQKLNEIQRSVVSKHLGRLF